MIIELSDENKLILSILMKNIQVNGVQCLTEQFPALLNQSWLTLEYEKFKLLYNE
jgi:hypothetical protein